MSVPAERSDLPGEHPAAARIREYFAVFHRSDSAGYAAQWIYPAVFWSGSDWVVVPDPAAMARNNDAYERAERARGMVTGEVVELRCEPLSASAALVFGRFDSRRADGSVIGITEAVYTVVLHEGAWRVAACVMRG
jgi:hypothetical protein